MTRQKMDVFVKTAQSPNILPLNQVTYKIYTAKVAEFHLTDQKYLNPITTENFFDHLKPEFRSLFLQKEQSECSS